MMSAMRFAQTNLQLYEQLASRPEADRVAVRKAYDFAARIFAGRYRGCGKPFVSHLVGTASILERHGAPLPVVLAGLLHAAYLQGEFDHGHAGLTAATRKLLRDAVGVEAEDLVARYTEFDWSRIPDGLGEEDRPVVLMRIANELDECLDRGLLYVGEKKRKKVAASVGPCAAAARAIGLPALADELEAAYEENRGELPATLATARSGSFRGGPKNTVRGFLRRKLRRLLR
jgi:hypothetical protein